MPTIASGGIEVGDCGVKVTVVGGEHATGDNMLGLGVTSMSAGSETEPGGYATSPEALEQFEVTDSRRPCDVTASIKAHGFDPVWKDWDAVFDK